MSSGPFIQWETWDVRWPYHDGRILPRPALLISPSAYNQSNPDRLVFVMISTQPHPEIPQQMTLESSMADFALTGLDPKRVSYVYFPNVKEIPSRDTLLRLGTLSADLAAEAWEIVQEVMRRQRGR